MKIEHTQRNFEYITLLGDRSIQQSSAIGDYEDAFDKPGSSFLWHGDDHLTREEVANLLHSGEWSDMLVPHIEAWLSTGSLEIQT